EDLASAIWSRRGSRPVVVLALREPYDLGRMPEGPALMAVYGTAPASLQAAAEALAGRFLPGGRLPVTIPGRWPAGYRWERPAR
ncbi:MAG: glycoside hydrolase family 3 C-terminal domain-containing protein, partial [Bacillota bacterium]